MKLFLIATILAISATVSFGQPYDCAANIGWTDESECLYWAAVGGPNGGNCYASVDSNIEDGCITYGAVSQCYCDTDCYDCLECIYDFGCCSDGAQKNWPLCVENCMINSPHCNQTEYYN